MKSPINSPTFPSNFPQELAKVAFTSGNEAAWQQDESLSAIRWFAENGYAILGFDLWLAENDGIRTAISTKAGPAICVWSCDRTKGETWQDYVHRSAQEAIKAVGFPWFKDALEPPRPVYFNLCWADQEWCEKNAERIADE